MINQIYLLIIFLNINMIEELLELLNQIFILKIVNLMIIFHYMTEVFSMLWIHIYLKLKILKHTIQQRWKKYNYNMNKIYKYLN